MDFNPRPPRGERLQLTRGHYHCKPFQSTPSARRATPPPHDLMGWHPISIHALREEGDGRVTDMIGGGWLFQSTPSARRATSGNGSGSAAAADFNPRPPRGERPGLCGRPSPSHRISIHALREESDNKNCARAKYAKHFNPRPPRGGRPGAVFNAISPALFQSTPSAKRATRRVQCVRSEDQHFNPRPPRGERLQAGGRHPAERINFNPRPPRGERPFSTGI